MWCVAFYLCCCIYITIYNHFGLCNDVLTHPLSYASYAIPVRQGNLLQSRLLQCMDHSKPPCGLLMLRDVTPRIKRLSLSGFLFLRTIFTIQGAPGGLAIWRCDEYILNEIYSEHIPSPQIEVSAYRGPLLKYLVRLLQAFSHSKYKLSKSTKLVIEKIFSIGKQTK
jgi:hypothetical protein